MNHLNTQPLQHLPFSLTGSGSGTAALLLDAVAQAPLLSRIYQWSDNPQVDPLYLQTPWQELLELSPCLVFLSGPQDPALAGFLNEAELETGWLLLSEQPPEAISQHLRRLLTVQPPYGDPSLLRISDPATAHVLFGHAEQQGNRALFGPIEAVCCPDSLLQTWHCHSAPRSTAPPWSEPYQLDQQQWTLLEQVAFRQAVLTLRQHMQQYFPDYQAHLSLLDQGLHWQKLTEIAYKQGFCNLQEILLFANIHGYLGPDALIKHSDLQESLQKNSTGSPLFRVKKVAREAATRAHRMEQTT